MHAKGDILGLPAAGIKVVNGDAQTVDDKVAAIALSNPHVRLESDKETRFQREQRERQEAADAVDAASNETPVEAVRVDVTPSPVSAATTRY
jgi:hypothetical protein